MIKNRSEVEKAFSRVMFGEVNFISEYDTHWIFDVDGESYKIRKDDYAVHYYSGTQTWEYDFDLTFE